MSAPKPLDGFEVFEFSDQGMSHPVYVRGSGPGVLLMHELPGMVPQCVELARTIADRGFTVFMPLMFGEANAPPATSKLAARVCISQEFHCFAQHQSSPITRWLRSLCALKIRSSCPGPGIGAIGMCFTGGFVLSLFVDDQLLAPVLCQPGLPFKSLKPGAGAALGVSPEDLQEARTSSAPILGFRFEGDTICPKQRFETLRATFGSRFEGHELPGSDHSVMTLSFVNDPAHPTFQARERLFAFLHERLAVPAASGAPKPERN
jgi:dienelactone hydrolase